MSRHYKWLAEIGLGILFFGLLGYAASRTLDFVQNTISGDNQILGYLYLLATGIGSVIWLGVYAFLAKGFKRRGISFAMGIIDLIAEFCLVYVDTMVASAAQGLVQQLGADETRVFVIVSVGIIGLNILAVYFYHLFSPEIERNGTTEDFVDEIEAAALKKLKSPKYKQQMIDQHAPMLEMAIMNEVEMRVRDMAAQMASDRIKALTGLTTQPAAQGAYDFHQCEGGCGRMIPTWARFCSQDCAVRITIPTISPRPTPAQDKADQPQVPLAPSNP
jgi:hypothetical protein